MTVQEALVKGIAILKEAKIDSPVVDTGVILCHVLNCDKTYLYAHNEEILKQSREEQFFKCMKKRAENYPIQYLLGHQEFMSLNFYVDENVLIPRHDTEILVEAIINTATGDGSSWLPQQENATTKNRPLQQKLEILDIGTGSGCISISLAHYIKNCNVTALDISQKALNVAKRNSTLNGVENKIRFIQSDIFSELHNKDYRFDIIVSNPPYISRKEIETLDMQVREYEPLSALDGGADGLVFYKQIINESSLFLKEKGLLGFEVGYNQSNEVEGLMSNKFYDIQIIKDISGIERVVLGKLKKI